MASFSSGSTLQVAYTKRPPGLSKRAALCSMAACLTCSSAKSLCFCRHFKSGLRRKVPKPVQGASTSTRSILPARRLTRSSRSWAMAAVCTLDKPLRATRGLSASSRCAEVSKAYRRPVLRIIAPKASVLPPAPAQKSTTISPRLASTSMASSCEPSSCTSISPQVKTLSLLTAGRPCTRRPQGEYSVGTALMPSRDKSFCAASRLVVKALMRISSGAGTLKQSINGQKSSPNCALSDWANHSGRLWRCSSSRPESGLAGSVASQASSQFFSRSDRDALT